MVNATSPVALTSGKAGLDGCGKSRSPSGFGPQSIQPVASRYTDWPISANSRTGCIWNAYTNFRSEFPAPQLVHITICFLGTAPTFGRPRSFRFLSVGTVKNPSVLSSDWKWRDFSNAYFMPVISLANAPGPLKGYPCIYRSRWRIFWAFVVNCN